MGHSGGVGVQVVVQSWVRAERAELPATMRRTVHVINVPAGVRGHVVPAACVALSVRGLPGGANALGGFGCLSCPGLIGRLPDASVP
jgi:hypothetical protein